MGGARPHRLAALATSPVGGQRQPITHRWRSCSWDVFPYDLFPNQLRPLGLAFSTGQQRGKLLCRYFSRSLPCYSGEGGPRERWKGHKRDHVFKTATGTHLLETIYL